MGRFKQFVRREVARRGYLLAKLPAGYGDFRGQAEQIITRHRAQSVADVQGLRVKYERPVFGQVQVWDLVQKLGMVCDPSDGSLGCTSQLVHVLQVLQAMEEDGVDDPEMLIAAIVHDLGKLLLLTDEAPENVVCMVEPVGSYEMGVGLENCVLQWNHDEFIYSRLKDHLPDHIAWLLRYHSIYIDQCWTLMDDRDRRHTKQYLRPFQHYDQDFKSSHALPKKGIEAYREIVESWFPDPIQF